MWEFGMSETNAVDVCGFDIIFDADDSGTPVSYTVVGYGFGFQLPLATVPLAGQAKALLRDMVYQMKDGLPFYDVNKELQTNRLKQVFAEQIKNQQQGG